MSTASMNKDRILALINEGRERRETPIPAPPMPTPDPPPREPAHTIPPPSAPILLESIPDEPPAEAPTELDPMAGLPRRRRVGLRSDPDWTQKTLYLRRATITEAEGIARAMGVEFSELVEWALALQVRDGTRAPSLSAILDQMKG